MRKWANQYGHGIIGRKHWIRWEIVRTKEHEYSIIIRVSYKSPRSGHDFNHTYNLKFLFKSKPDYKQILNAINGWKQSLLEELSEPLFNKLVFDIGIIKKVGENNDKTRSRRKQKRYKKKT